MQLCKKKNPHYYNDRVDAQDLITCTFRRKHFIFSVTETSGDFLTIPKQLHSAFKVPFCVTQICKLPAETQGTGNFSTSLEKCATIPQPLELGWKIAMMENQDE